MGEEPPVLCVLRCFVLADFIMARCTKVSGGGGGGGGQATLIRKQDDARMKGPHLLLMSDFGSQAHPFCEQNGPGMDLEEGGGGQPH